MIAALSDILQDGVGEPLADNELREARKIGLLRIADKVPPGWKDADKRENKEGRVVNQLGIEEIVNFGDLKILTPRKYSVQFDGWAVADPAGKSAGALSKRFVTELCESVGRTGYGDVVAALPD